MNQRHRTHRSFLSLWPLGTRQVGHVRCGRSLGRCAFRDIPAQFVAQLSHLKSFLTTRKSIYEVLTFGLNVIGNSEAGGRACFVVTFRFSCAPFASFPFLNEQLRQQHGQQQLL